MTPPAVERAVFTSSRSGRIEGYQLTAVSDGVSSADRQELSRWSPAHDALLDEGMGAESVNFHRLDSGTFCVSRTIHAGAEYSGRGGLRVFTELLLPPPELLARFANNPFRLLEAATAAGYVGGGIEPAGDRLEPFHLTGGASNVDCILLARLARFPGPDVTARFVDAVLKNPSLAIDTRASLRKLIAGLFSLLPVELRAAFSFSSGLKPSKQRAFRIQPLESDAPRGAARRNGDPQRLWLDEPSDSGEPAHPWSQLVQCLLASGATAPFCRALSVPRPGFCESDLAVLAKRIGANLTMDKQPASREAAAG